MKLTKEYMEEEIKKERRLESIRKGSFFVGIVGSAAGFLIAKIYTFAFLLLTLGIGMLFYEYSNKKAIELILQKDKG